MVNELFTRPSEPSAVHDRVIPPELWTVVAPITSTNAPPYNRVESACESCQKQRTVWIYIANVCYSLMQRPSRPVLVSCGKDFSRTVVSPRQTETP